MIIGVQNLSTLVSEPDAYAMTLIVNEQLRSHVAPAWNQQPPRVEFIPVAGPGTVSYDAIIGILDDSDQAGALGWHTEGPNADVYGRVFARPVLENGGNTLTAGLSVCSVLSHECCETFLDPACNGWAQDGSGTLTARELCDPVESDSYLITITAQSGEQVRGTVSNFVLPAWFDPDAATPGPNSGTDYLGLCHQPFQVRATGYSIVMQAGVVSESWGEHYPAWRQDTKAHSTSRTARRDPSVIAPTALA